MILAILLAVLGLGIGLINFLCQTRREADKRLTRWGKTVAVLSIAVCALSLWKVQQDSERDRRARYVLTDSDVEIRLTAFTFGTARSPDLEFQTPSAMDVGLVIPSEGGWRCLLEAIPGFVVYSGPGRGPSAFTRVYLTKTTVKIGEKALVQNAQR
jgi:hypothetical protein